MKGFKNSTKTQSGHGDSKIATVMHEYGAGKLHSGSKSGPVVKSPKQAVAIAISEQRKAPIKKADGGRISEEPSRPLTAKELAAAKSMKINTPGKSVPTHKSAPKVTNGMILGKGEDRAPGERGAKKLSWEERADRLMNRLNREDTGDSNTTGRYLDEKDFADWTSQRNPNARKLTTGQLKSFLSENSAKPKRFAVGGMVPPVASGGMPARGQPITAKNANDARVRPMPVAPKAPLIAPSYRPTRNSGLPQAWRDNYAADSARRLGTNPQPTARDLMNRKDDALRDRVAAAGGSKAYLESSLIGKPGTKPPGYDAADDAVFNASRSTGKPAEPTAPRSVPSPMSPERRAKLSADMKNVPTTKGYKKGGKVADAKGGKSRWS